MADLRTRTAVKITDPTTDANEAAVDASGNLQTILAANTGVDIGDVDVTSVIPGTAATDLGKAVDVLAGGSDVGVAALAVRDDVLAGLTPADGDYTPMFVDANGALWTKDVGVDAALTGSELQVDVVAPLPAGTNNIGDVDILSVIPGVGATNLGKAEDAAHGDGDTGVLSLSVRRDADTSIVTADNDYAPLQVDATGYLKVNVKAGSAGGTEFNEDDPASGGEAGSLSLGVRQDADTSPVSADGDFHNMVFDANGALKVNVKSGGGETVPTTPVKKTANSTNTAAGAAFENDSVELGGSTVKCAGFDAAASVPFRVQLMEVNDNAETVLMTMFGGPANPVSWRPPHRNYYIEVFAANAGFDGFRVEMVNNDTSAAADLYSTLYYED